jgi:hypothetical protein
VRTLPIGADPALVEKGADDLVGLGHVYFLRGITFIHSASDKD